MSVTISPIIGDRFAIANKMEKESTHGEHSLVVYSDRDEYMKLLSSFTKYQLQEKNEAVLIISHYDTKDRIRSVLKQQANLDVPRYEKDNFLVFLDSVNCYFTSNISLNTLLAQFVEYMQNQGKKGISVISDMGAFLSSKDSDRLIKYEQSVKLSPEIPIKGFCCYDRRDYKSLSHTEQETLAKTHDKNLLIEAWVE